MNTKVEGCPVCGCTNRIRISHTDRYRSDATFSYCIGCALIYLDPTWSEDEYKDFYDTKYRELIKGYRGRQNIEENQAVYGKALANWLRDNDVKADSLLDVGGSTGIVANEIVKVLGCKRVDVVDPNTEELSKARALGFTTYKDIDLLPLDGDKYDLVICCRTIDHLLNPVMMLSDMRDQMRLAGRLYIDFCDWTMVARSEGFTNSLHIDHPCNFNGNSFLRLLNRCGLIGEQAIVLPRSSCYGLICRIGESLLGPMKDDHLAAIRELQAKEREQWQGSAY